MTARRELRWKRSAIRELKKLPRPTRIRVLRAVEDLPSNPSPAGARKLVGAQHTFRIRIGHYRVVYSVATEELVIEILRVRHRKDAYR